MLKKKKANFTLEIKKKTKEEELLAVTLRSLLERLKLKSVLQQRSEGHVRRRVECFGWLSYRWSSDGGVRLFCDPELLAFSSSPP